MTQAQIVNGAVHWLATDTQAAAYAPGLLQFATVPAGATVAEGWLYDAQTGAFSAPAALAAPALQPVPLTPLQFIVYLQEAAGLTNTQIAALKASTDPNIGAFMLMLQLAGREILPTGKLVTQGLALLVADNYLTGAQATAVVANWPTSPPAV